MFLQLVVEGWDFRCGGGAQHGGGGGGGGGDGGGGGGGRNKTRLESLLCPT
jgi:hypothetical protein